MEKVIEIISLLLLQVLTNFASGLKLMPSLETNSSDLHLTLDPANMTELPWKHTKTLLITYVCENLTEFQYENGNMDYIDQRTLHILSRNKDYVEIGHSDSFSTTISCFENTTANNNQLSVPVTGKFLGVTTLGIYVDYNTTNEIKYAEYQVVVINEETVLYTTFIVVVAILVVVLNFGFGCIIHVNKVKEILKKPAAPAIGLFCQIILMPLVSDR